MRQLKQHSLNWQIQLQIYSFFLNLPILHKKTYRHDIKKIKKTLRKSFLLIFSVLVFKEKRFRFFPMILVTK
jgi:hypothetical protein